MSIGNEFQADGAETAKALSVNRRRVRRVMKSPLDLERSQLSVHGLHSSQKYNGAVPREARYIKTHSLNLMRLSCGFALPVAKSGTCTKIIPTRHNWLNYTGLVSMSVIHLVDRVVYNSTEHVTCVPCVAELSGSCVSIHAYRSLPYPKCLV